MQAMRPADVHRFLVVCALVSDLYCPGYNPKQALERDSNLALTAARYKIDVAKVGVTVRAELAKNKQTKAEAKEPKTSQSAPSRQCELAKPRTTKQHIRLMVGAAVPPGAVALSYSERN